MTLRSLNRSTEAFSPQYGRYPEDVLSNYTGTDYADHWRLRKHALHMESPEAEHQRPEPRLHEASVQIARQHRSCDSVLGPPLTKSRGRVTSSRCLPHRVSAEGSGRQSIWTCPIFSGFRGLDETGLQSWVMSLFEPC